MYSGWIFENKILQSTARAMRRPKPSQDKLFTTPEFPGTLNERR